MDEWKCLWSMLNNFFGNQKALGCQTRFQYGAHDSIKTCPLMTEGFLWCGVVVTHTTSPNSNWIIHWLAYQLVYPQPLIETHTINWGRRLGCVFRLVVDSWFLLGFYSIAFLRRDVIRQISFIRAHSSTYFQSILVGRMRLRILKVVHLCQYS